MAKVIYVKKKGGKREKFKKAKLYKSVKKAGVSSGIAKRVTNSVAGKVKNNMSTAKVKKIVYRTLKKYSKKAAENYKKYKKR